MRKCFPSVPVSLAVLFHPCYPITMNRPPGALFGRNHDATGFTDSVIFSLMLIFVLLFLAG